MVVAPDADIRRAAVLKNAGHDAVLAAAGNDALQQFERQLRGLDPAAPVIMMSGGAPSIHLWGTTQEDFLAAAERFGATRTIEKPFKYSHLLGLVRECLAAG